LGEEGYWGREGIGEGRVWAYEGRPYIGGDRVWGKLG